MTDLDYLSDQLRSQMRTATAADIAPPDLLERVNRSAARRRQRNTGAFATLVIASGLAAMALPNQGASPEPERLGGPDVRTEGDTAVTAPADGLSIVRADGGSLAVEVGSYAGQVRTERAQLPGYLRNSSRTAVTVLEMSVPGTTLMADLPQPVKLVAGGRLPLTLVRRVDCNAEPSLPSELNIRVFVTGANGRTSVLLPLPEEVVALYRTGHACSQERRAADDAEADAHRMAEEAERKAGDAAGK